MIDETPERVIVIADKTVQEYFWIIALELVNHNRVVLHVTNKYLGTVERLIKMWSVFKIEEFGQRERIKTINQKNNTPIEANRVELRKSGVLL